VQTGSDEQMKDQQRSIWKQDKKSQCEINKVPSANRIRKANVRKNKDQSETGSEDQM
jgi:hypothetical protein